MAKHTNIAWATSTFNPWIGCTKVAPGCDNCYADAIDKRMRFGGELHWGVGAPRHRTSASNWAQVRTWNRKAAAGQRPWRVFCGSLADIFDNEVPQSWRWELWHLINETPALQWLIVTKRVGNVPTMVPQCWYNVAGFPANVRLLITVCNQQEADRDIPKLLALPCDNGISYEPALEPVNFREWLEPFNELDATMKPPNRPQWIIVGGESAQGRRTSARPFDLQWARDTIAQCKAADVPVFVKQLGSNIIVPNDSVNEWPNEEAFFDNISDDYIPQYQGELMPLYLQDRAGADPNEWPTDLRVQEFP